MGQFLHTLRRLFKTKENPVETTDIYPLFDKKFKNIVKLKYTSSYVEMMHWADKNSVGPVDIKFSGGDHLGEFVYFAFGDSDDALIFRIKYST